jgi:hypothetical protein
VKTSNLTYLYFRFNISCTSDMLLEKCLNSPLQFCTLISANVTPPLCCQKLGMPV